MDADCSTYVERRKHTLIFDVRRVIGKSCDFVSESLFEQVNGRGGGTIVVEGHGRGCGEAIGVEAVLWE